MHGVLLLRGLGRLPWEAHKSRGCFSTLCSKQRWLCPALFPGQLQAAPASLDCVASCWGLAAPGLWGTWVAGGSWPTELATGEKHVRRARCFLGKTVTTASASKTRIGGIPCIEGMVQFLGLSPTSLFSHLFIG